MRYLDLTLPTAAENLALDEALLDEAEQCGSPMETLRLWEPVEPMVVVGRSSSVDAEVHLKVCRERGIPVLRRTSGGAAIVTGPGCLMYSLVLSYRLRPGLRVVDNAHRFVLQELASALKPLVQGVVCRGTSDLAIDDRKFSGNSMRCKREHLLYHGTLLYNFDLQLVPACLRTPSRQPDYREGRSHETFVVNLPLPVASIRGAVAAIWGATQQTGHWPQDRTAALVAEKYGRREWNECR